MKLIQYERETHGRLAFDLWQRTVGQQYPIALEHFIKSVNKRTSYEDGDGIVAVESGQVIGFGMVEADYKNPLWNGWGGIMALLVDPAYRRKHIGSAILERLERRMSQVGCREMHLGETLHSFWPGPPEDLPAAKPFFAKHGYDFAAAMVTDLVIELEGYQMTVAHQALDDIDAEVLRATEDTFETVCQFEQREFPYWYDGMLQTGAEKEGHTILVVWRQGEVIGTVFTTHPTSHQRKIGLHIGTINGVGVAEAWRGRGVGAAMCQSAALYVKQRGARCCMIDGVEPELIDFYRRIGAKTGRKYHRGEKYVRHKD